jgi:hypothetical protein
MVVRGDRGHRRRRFPRRPSPPLANIWSLATRGIQRVSSSMLLKEIFAQIGRGRVVRCFDTRAVIRVPSASGVIGPETQSLARDWCFRPILERQSAVQATLAPWDCSSMGSDHAHAALGIAAFFARVIFATARLAFASRARISAQRLLVAAMIRFIPSSLIRRFGRCAAAGELAWGCPLMAAHLFF